MKTHDAGETTGQNQAQAHPCRSPSGAGAQRSDDQERAGTRRQLVTYLETVARVARGNQETVDTGIKVDQEVFIHRVTVPAHARVQNAGSLVRALKLEDGEQRAQFGNHLVQLLFRRHIGKVGARELRRVEVERSDLQGQQGDIHRGWHI